MHRCWFRFDSQCDECSGQFLSSEYWFRDKVFFSSSIDFCCKSGQKCLTSGEAVYIDGEQFGAEDFGPVEDGCVHRVKCEEQED